MISKVFSTQFRASPSASAFKALTDVDVFSKDVGAFSKRRQLIAILFRSDLEVCSPLSEFESLSIDFYRCSRRVRNLSIFDSKDILTSFNVL